jgi:hypothetical protein
MSGSLAQGTIRVAPGSRVESQASAAKAAASAQRGGESKGAPPSDVINGGAGICTRVRKYIPAGIYDAYPLLKSRSRRQEAANKRRKPVPVSLVTDVRDHASATSLLK